MAWTSPALPYPWYKEIDRPTAEGELLKQPPGSFIVRPRYVIGIKANKSQCTY